MNYLNNQDFYGILFKDVVNQYIVFENNNLKEFASKMGVEDTSEIPNKIEIPEIINYEDLLIIDSNEDKIVSSDLQYTDALYTSKEANTIINKYLNIAMEEIAEDNYSKIKKQDISLGDETVEADGYQVKLKVKDVQKILTKVLENARDDEQIYNLLNVEDITFEDYQTAIDELLLGLSEEIPSEENIEFITISVYKQGKETVKLSLKLAIEEAEVDVEISVENTVKGMMIKFVNTTINYDETQDRNIITITKTANSEEQENFEIVLSQESEEEKIELVNINIARNGLLTSNNINFIYSLSSNSEPYMLGTENMTLKMQLETTSNFAGVPLEGEFVQGNHLVINGLAPEQITNLFTNLGNMLGEKLKDEMFVSMIVGFNDSLFETAQQAQQETQNALEQESQLNSGTIEINGQTYSSMDEYLLQEQGNTTNQYRPENFSVNVQDTNTEQSTMSQMFSDGQEFLNN